MRARPAFLADLLAANRKLLEDIRFSIKAGNDHPADLFNAVEVPAGGDLPVASGCGGEELPHPQLAEREMV